MIGTLLPQTREAVYNAVNEHGAQAAGPPASFAHRLPLFQTGSLKPPLGELASRANELCELREVRYSSGRFQKKAIVLSSSSTSLSTTSFPDVF
jgi:hypothetical protein